MFSLIKNSISYQCRFYGAVLYSVTIRVTGKNMKNVVVSMLFLDTRSRSSMDRIQVCGTCDAGSIPAESTDTNNPTLNRVGLLVSVLELKPTTWLQCRNRIGVAESFVLVI